MDSILRLTTTGSVDDGKSTLIGRLMYETKSVPQDQYDAIVKASKSRGREFVDLSLLLDGLASERDQGITIDVAYRYIQTPKRKLIVADTPGHEQYTRNMITGASNSDLAVILIDAKNGVQTQSRRHGFLNSLLGIRDLVVIVNKMDLVSYDEKRYREIVEEYEEFIKKLDIKTVTYIPVSALEGENVTKSPKKMKWYSGPTFLEYLEKADPIKELADTDFRMFVQTVIRPDEKVRSFAGRISSGMISVGDDVYLSASKRSVKIKEIFSPAGSVKSARIGDSISVSLDKEIDIDRGELFSSGSRPFETNRFRSYLCWMDDADFDTSKIFYLKHGTRMVKAYINKVHSNVDVNTLDRSEAKVLKLNDIGEVSIETLEPLFVDTYTDDRSTGSFVLLDAESGNTSAAGMISEKFANGMVNKKRIVSTQAFNVTRTQRESQKGQKAFVIWFTGLSGSGKSTVSNELQKMLLKDGKHAYALDGDNIRRGLNDDLGFSLTDRKENIRRISEVAKLFVDSGIITLVSFISPLEEDREHAREIIGDEDFFEVYISTPIEECERRDKKGLYKKAREGEITNFTGISSPYEVPPDPDAVVDTTGRDVIECAEELFEAISKQWDI